MTARATVTVHLESPLGPVPPGIFGQFIEHYDRVIDGGIFDEDSPLADDRGFRLDVLEKVRELRPTVLRYPGGTFTKIHHWQDGIGPRDTRLPRPNLIWGGTVSNRFGTHELAAYARELGAETYLAINMGTGSAEEAANWVEYCNGTADTSYVRLRRRNGSPEPFGVRYWGIGNEERAHQDPGRVQDVEDYIREAWQYAKLMKLQDPSIRLVLAGADEEWDRRVLAALHPVGDYLSAHFYTSTPDRAHPASLFAATDTLAAMIDRLAALIREVTPDAVADIDPFYRFPGRDRPVSIALDELGIWEEPLVRGVDGRFHQEETYTWNHALAAATMLGIVLRRVEAVGMVTWAQTVNVLAPILADERGSIRQTVHHALRFVRDAVGTESLRVDLDGPPLAVPGAEDVPMLDVAATRGASGIAVLVVNRHPCEPVDLGLGGLGGEWSGIEVRELSAPAIDARNSLDAPDVEVVTETLTRVPGDRRDVAIAPRSITAIHLRP